MCGSAVGHREERAVRVPGHLAAGELTRFSSVFFRRFRHFDRFSLGTMRRTEKAGNIVLIGKGAHEHGKSANKHGNQNANDLIALHFVAGSLRPTRTGVKYILMAAKSSWVFGCLVPQATIGAHGAKDAEALPVLCANVVISQSRGLPLLSPPQPRPVRRA